MSSIRFPHVNVTGGVDPEQVPAAQVNADFFKLFGGTTIHGRTFTADEDRPGGRRVVVLSYGFWQRRFGGEPGIVGRTITLDAPCVSSLAFWRLRLTSRFSTHRLRSGCLCSSIPTVATIHRRSEPRAVSSRGITVDAANAEARLAGMEFGRLFPDAAAPNDTFSLAPFQSLMVSHARPALCAVIGVATLAFSFAKVRFPSLSAKVVGPRCYREFSPSAVLRAPVNARIASAARGAPPASMKDRRMTSAWERNRSSERRR